MIFHIKEKIAKKPHSGLNWPLSKYVVTMFCFCRSVLFLEFREALFLIVCFRCQRKLIPSDAIDLLTRCACTWAFLYAVLHALWLCLLLRVVGCNGSYSTGVAILSSPHHLKLQNGSHYYPAELQLVLSLQGSLLPFLSLRQLSQTWPEWACNKRPASPTSTIPLPHTLCPTGAVNR